MSKPKTEADIQIPNEMLRELLTSSELRMLKNRWQIIQLLKRGLSIRDVSGRVKVGTDTVVRVARIMKKENLKKFFKEREEEKKEGRARQKTSYIFGESRD